MRRFALQAARDCPSSDAYLKCMQTLALSLRPGADAGAVQEVAPYHTSARHPLIPSQQ